MLSKTARHGTARHGTARHGTARHGTARHGTARHGTARHGTARHGTARHGTARHGTARHGTARHGTARHGTARHGTARHGTARHGTARHGTARTSWYHFTSIWPPNDVFDYFTFYLSFSASLPVPLNKILASLIANDSYVRRCSLVSICSFALIFEAINLSSRALILSDSAWNVSSACFSDYKNDFPQEKVKYLLYRWQL